MPDDFASAASRHWDNSVFLYDNGRFQEAAYLAGYVAECTLKFCIVTADPSANVRKLAHNLPVLTSDGLELAKILNPLMNRYHLSHPLSDLLEWSEQHRYEKTGFWTDGKFKAIILQAHQVVEQILITMVLDGFLEEVPL